MRLNGWTCHRTPQTRRAGASSCATRPSASTPRRRRRRGPAAAAAVSVAAVAAVALALTLPGDVPDRPTIVDAAALSDRPATRPAPARDPFDRRSLALNMEGVSFPDWAG